MTEVTEPGTPPTGGSSVPVTAFCHLHGCQKCQIRHFPSLSVTCYGVLAEQEKGDETHAVFRSIGLAAPPGSCGGEDTAEMACGIESEWLYTTGLVLAKPPERPLSRLREQIGAEIGAS